MFFTKYNENDQVKRDETGMACITHWKKRNACRILVGKSEGNRLLGRTKSSWENNIKMDFREID
jgi:hypothetical protein